MTTTGEHLVASSTISTGTALEHFANLSTFLGALIVDLYEVELQDIELEFGTPEFDIEIELLDDVEVDV
jgi:hypothetical protein